MARHETKLTSRPEIAKIKNPPSGTDFYSHDGDALKGIRLAVGARTKSWILSKRINGKVRSIKLGDWPDLPTGLQANEVAQDKINEIVTKQDADSTGIRTMRDAMIKKCAQARAENELKPETEETYWIQVNTHMADIFDMALEDVTFDILNDRITKIRLSGKQSTADHCITLMKMAFKRACQSRPLRNVADMLKKPKKVVKADEDKLHFDANETWPALDLILAKRQTSLLIGTAWLVMLFTGFRSINVRSLEWSQINLDKKTIKLTAMKNGLDRTFPVSDIVIEALKTLPHRTGQVFATNTPKSGTGHIGNPDPLPRNGPILFPHDTRRLFTTAGRRLRIPGYMVEQMRGDAPKSVVDGYDVGSMSHDDANRIAQRICEDCGTTPAFVLDRIKVSA